MRGMWQQYLRDRVGEVPLPRLQGESLGEAERGVGECVPGVPGQADKEGQEGEEGSEGLWP